MVKMYFPDIFFKLNKDQPNEILGNIYKLIHEAKDDEIKKEFDRELLVARIENEFEQVKLKNKPKRKD